MIWLVVTGTWLDGFFIQLGISSSQLTNSYFSAGVKPPSSDPWFGPWHRLIVLMSADVSGWCTTNQAVLESSTYIALSKNMVPLHPQVDVNHHVPSFLSIFTIESTVVNRHMMNSKWSHACFHTPHAARNDGAIGVSLSKPHLVSPQPAGDILDHSRLKNVRGWPEMVIKHGWRIPEMEP